MDIKKQQENIKHLLKLIQENPELPIIPMIHWEVVGEDIGCWRGSWQEAFVDEMLEDKEGIQLRTGGDEDNLIEEVVDTINDWGKTEDEIREEASKIVANYDWKKCILVRIGLPE